MKPVLVVYATREGQTQQVAEHVAEALQRAGLSTELVHLGSNTGLVLAKYSGAILAASIHAGEHESEMIRFAHEHRGELDLLPNAFLSVSLTEAQVEDWGREEEDRAAAAKKVRHFIERFVEETQWHPEHVRAVAGALRFSKYNFVVRYIMKKAAQDAGLPSDPTQDHVMTNFHDVDELVAEFARELGAQPAS